MTTVKTKTKCKKIRTVLTVRFMEGKSRRDMYREFFKGKLPQGFDDKMVKTLISLEGYSGTIPLGTIPYELYKKFSGLGASREFLESFKFSYITEYKSVDSYKIVKCMYEVVPFLTVSNIDSYIVSYSLGNDRLETSSDLLLEIETHSYQNDITADEIKRINKDNARRLRHYLVSLPSVQGVPYSCTFREDESNELECSI